MEVVLRILPIFALMGVGAVAARFGTLTEAAAARLSRYVYWIAFPALLLHALATTARPDGGEVRDLLVYALALAGPSLLAAGLARLRRWPADARAALPLLAGVPNDAFVGAPLAAAVLGPAAAGFTGPLVAVTWSLIAPATVAVLHRGARGGSWWAAARGAALNPVTVGALAGAACLLLLPHAPGRPPWPAPVETVLAALAASSTPVALTALGATVASEGLRPTTDETAPVLAAVALRLLVGPAIVWGALTLAGAPPPMRAAAVVLAACPSGVTGFIQARTYGVWPRPAAQVVVLATLASAVTLTLLLSVLAPR